MEVNFKTEALVDLELWKKYGSESEQKKNNCSYTKY
jgi:hypothetical protein